MKMGGVGDLGAWRLGGLETWRLGGLGTWKRRDGVYLRGGCG